MSLGPLICLIIEFNRDLQKNCFFFHSFDDAMNVTEPELMTPPWPPYFFKGSAARAVHDTHYKFNTVYDVTPRGGLVRVRDSFHCTCNRCLLFPRYTSKRSSFLIPSEQFLLLRRHVERWEGDFFSVGTTALVSLPLCDGVAFTAGHQNNASRCCVGCGAEFARQ